MILTLTLMFWAQITKEVQIPVSRALPEPWTLSLNCCFLFRNNSYVGEDGLEYFPQQRPGTGDGQSIYYLDYTISYLLPRLYY